MKNTVTSSFLDYINNNNGIFIYDSWVNWEITTILTWVHGNEISWIIALEKILEKIDIVKWKVNFIVWNIKAVESNVRFIDVDMNWIFDKFDEIDKYESKRIREIIKYLEESDSMLDIHNTLNDWAIPFLLTEQVQARSLFNTNYVVEWFDNLHGWSSDRFVNKKWWRWYCLEAWYYWEISSHELAYNSILNFLKYTWNIRWVNNEYDILNSLIFDYKYTTKTWNFKLTKKYNDFDRVTENDIIWYDDWIAIKAPYSSYILFAYSPENSNRTAFCLWKNKFN